MDGLSPGTLADMKSALDGEGTDGLGGGGGMWMIIIILFLFMMGGGAMFGNTKETNVSVPAAAAFGGYGFGESVAIRNSFAHQEEVVKLDMIDRDVLLGNANNEKTMLMSFNAMQAQMNDCCCKLEMKMDQQEIQNLRDKVNAQDIMLSNQNQTQAILGQLGHYATNPPCYPQVQAVPYGCYPPFFGGFDGFRDGRRDGFRDGCGCC